MNELMVFNNPEFGEIRTIEENGKVLFCGNDAAKEPWRDGLTIR